MPFLLAVLFTLVFAPAANAAWFGLDTLDGPSADIEGLGGVDLARDGTGGLAYVKRDGGIPHVYVSRHYLGAFQAPERIDNGLDLAVTEAAVAASDNFRLAVVWIAGPRLYGALYGEGTLPGTLQGPALIYEDPQGRPLSGLSFDMGINGTAFATFTAAGPAGGDIRAVRLLAGAWEQVASPLDVDVAQDAGTGSSRSRVAVAADGNPVVVWGETHADGRRRAYERRIYGLAPSNAPQELSVPDFEGAAGGNADSPDIDIEWDGSFAWAVWRQDIGGRSRTLTRRLRGTLFEPAAAIDGGQSSGAPHIAINGRGAGFTSAAIGDTLAGSQIEFDKLLAAQRIDSAGGMTGDALVAVSDNDNVDAGFVWRRADGELRGRYKPFDVPFEGEATLSRPELGPVAAGGFAIGSDRTGDIAVAALVGEPGARRIAHAMYDVPPGTPVTGGDRGFQRSARPLLKWRSGLDLLGQQSFKVLIDGREYARVTETQYAPEPALVDGMHTWQVVAVDVRGQEKPGTVRKIGVDALPPRVTIRVSGRRRAGRPVRITARAFDGRGSGVASVVIDFGDRSRKVTARSASHRYRAGTFRVKVRATDRLGRKGTATMKLRIRR
jgi:hypothetical protein